jgi:peptidyl-prolyl cis-trans isomerase B (cyclophilin B)
VHALPTLCQPRQTNLGGAWADTDGQTRQGDQVATTSQRRRQLARLRWEKQQARRAAAAARVRRRRRVLAVVLIFALVVASVAAAVVWWPWAGDDATTAEETPTPAAEGSCTYMETGSEDPVAGLPPATPAVATTATLTIGGKPVSVELLPDAAPCTVGSFAHLAANGYFDATTCHRLTTAETLKVLQCGDPTGSGSGGPGYQFGIENTEGATYPAATVAMAHGAGDPGSNGSQFFVVYGDSELPPEYTVFGRVTEGLDVITDIAVAGTADGSTDGAPKTPVRLDEVVTDA